MKKRVGMQKIFSLVLFVCLCVSAFAVQAQDSPGILNVPPVPAYLMPQEEFESKTKLFQDKPGGDSFLSYVLRIPSDWQQVRVNDGSKVLPDSSIDEGKKSSLLSEIARFYGPSLLDAQSHFVLQSSELKHDITARNWFMNYILQNGYTLQFMTEISENKIEAIYFQLEKDTAYISRAIAEMNGSRMILAMYSIPETRFQEERTMQANVLRSFKFLTPQKAAIEARRTYSFLNLLRFDYPESWRLLAPNIYSVDSMDARIINSPDESIPNGEIDIRIVSTELDTTLAQEIKGVQESVKKRGLAVGKLIEEPHKYKFNDHIYFSRVEVYETSDSEGAFIDHEYWICVLVEDRYFYIVTMLTPARTIDFYNWATNTEAFETVIETLRP